MSLRPTLFLVLLAGCDGKELPVDPDDSADDPADDSAAPDDDSGEPDDSATDDRLATVSGTITWNVDFDADAEADGAADCAYTRAYTGIEDRSAPWLCPDCELLFLADADIADGQDCYDLVSASVPAATEWLAYEDGRWYRASTSGMTERGASAFDGETWTVEQVSDASESLSGTVVYTITGTLTVGQGTGDILNGWAASETYDCGWPQADPPAYDGDYSVEIGGTLPDGLFPDVCEDTVRLHDLSGRYLVVDISAMDCGPCQSAAADEEAFVEAMAEQGIEVMIVTLLAPSLSNTAATATTEEITAWIEEFGLSSPVLGDRMWGMSVIGGAVGDDFGYPAFAVVNPALEVLDLHVGYSSFDDMAALIAADAAE